MTGFRSKSAKGIIIVVNRIITRIRAKQISVLTYFFRNQVVNGGRKEESSKEIESNGNDYVNSS